VRDLVAAAMRQREGRITTADGRQLGRKVGELMGDDVDHFAFALDAPAHGKHAGA
jgi:hypothetical protein